MFEISLTLLNRGRSLNFFYREAILKFSTLLINPVLQNLPF